VTVLPAKQPVLFISHGAPTYALEPGLAGAQLAALGRTLARPAAVLVVSPHWMTHGLRVAVSEQPSTLHDFGGFPAPLYELRYPAPGHPALARRAIELLAAAGWPVAADDRWGLDHGAWVPLLHLLPRAEVPVFQVSMPHDLDETAALLLGHTLAPLSDEGVLIVGSGSLTHNLHEVRFGDTTAEPYAQAFVNWARQAVLAHDAPALRQMRSQAPHAARAHPTLEHYLPVVVAIGAARGRRPTVLEGGMRHGVLSMESYGFGLAAPTPAH
jgi:4,5-DOPA dioxygenase extradiol